MTPEKMKTRDISAELRSTQRGKAATEAERGEAAPKVAQCFQPANLPILLARRLFSAPRP
jgi:hypothetical protein